MADRRFKTLPLDDIGLLRMDWNAGYGVEEHCNGCGENAGTWQVNRPLECAQHSSTPIHRKPPCRTITKHLIDQTFFRSDSRQPCAREAAKEVEHPFPAGDRIIRFKELETIRCTRPLEAAISSSPTSCVSLIPRCSAPALMSTG
jgi:hypothetical protein